MHKLHGFGTAKTAFHKIWRRLCQDSILDWNQQREEGIKGQACYKLFWQTVTEHVAGSRFPIRVNGACYPENVNRIAASVFQVSLPPLSSVFHTSVFALKDPSSWSLNRPLPEYWAWLANRLTWWKTASWKMGGNLSPTEARLQISTNGEDEVLIYTPIQ